MADDDLWEEVQHAGSKGSKGGKGSKGTGKGADKDKDVVLGKGAKITDLHERLLRQAVDETGAPCEPKWHLDDEQLDLAAFEQLLLTLPNTEEHLRARERETFGYVASKCGYSKRRQRELYAGVTRGMTRGEREQFEEELIDAVEQVDELEGYLEKQGEKKKGVKGGGFKKRWFQLADSRMDYSEKPGSKSKGSIDLTNATSCEAAGPMDPLTFYVNLPTRKFTLRSEDPFDAQRWVTTLQRIISHNQEAKEGSLEKQGAKNKSFKTRWFRILGTKMYYYKNAGDSKPAGVIDLEGATSCRKSADDTNETDFSIGIDGRNYVLRAQSQAERDGWIADISRRCPALEGMDGFLIRYGKRGKKGQERWFKLLGKRLLYFKQPGAKSEDGEIPLEFARSCRPHAASEDDTEFEIELPKSTFRMKAATPDQCREWITAISAAISSGLDDGEDAADYDDAEMPNTHLMSYRWELLKEKSPTDDFDSVGDFLQWRKRQLVILGSGLHHQIDHLRESKTRSSLVPSDTKLDRAVKALKAISNAINSSKEDLADWSVQDDKEWLKRLEDLDHHLDVVFESDEQVPLSQWGEDGDEIIPTFICHFPLHLGSFFVERLLQKACFEEEEFGGGLDFQRDNVDELLRHMGRRLKFPEGMHEVSFACALVEQYKLVVAQDQDGQEVVEVLGEEIEAIDLDCPALRTMAAEACLLHVQKFSMATLCSYHQLAEPTYIAHFVQVFSEIMRLRRQMQEKIQERMEKQIWDSVDKRYTTFWDGAIEIVKEKFAGEPEYDDEGERLPRPEVDTEKLDPLEILQTFCDMMSDEIDQEVGEYAAYIGTCMESPDDAGMTVVRSIAHRLNADIREAYQTVEAMTEIAMTCWASLRALEVKLVDVMLSCGVEGADAKLLHVDDALVKVAYHWMEKKEEQFNERMQNMINMETWVPFNDDASFAACGVDMVSMIISVAQQYFDAELPVSAKITVNTHGKPMWDSVGAEPGVDSTEKEAVRILADKFGFALQRFGQKILHQCGEEPRAPWRAEEKTGMRGRATTMISSNIGKGLGKGLTGLNKIRQSDDGDEYQERDDEQVADSITEEAAGGVSIEGMCIRMATINYVADQCKHMCNELEQGCQRNMFTADWVPKALEERKLELKNMVKSLAHICSASVVYVHLNSQLYQTIYKPVPSKAPLLGSEVFDALEGFLETIMINAPDECYLEFKRASDAETEDVALREIILELMLTNIVKVLDYAINAFRGAHLIELTVEDEDTEVAEVDQNVVAADVIELAEYFKAGGEGLRDQVAQNVTAKLNTTWESVRDEAIEAKKMGKTAKELDKEAGKDSGVAGGAAAALTGGVGGLTKGLGASMGLAKKKDEGDFKAGGFFDDDDDDEDTENDDDDNAGGLAAVATGLTAGLTSGLEISSAVGDKLMTGMTDTALGFAAEVEEQEFAVELREEIKVTIPARSRYTYKIAVQQMMGAVIFNFTIAKYDIHFSVRFLATSGGDDGTAKDIDGWEDGLREAGSMKGIYTPAEDGSLQLIWDNSRSLMYSKNVEFKVQLLADTMAEAMAMHDEGPLDEEEIEARTQIKPKRGRFGTLGSMAAKTGRMGKGAAKQAGSMTKAATTAAAEKTTAAANAATQLEVGAVGDKLSHGRSSLEGGAAASLGVVKGVGGGALGVGKGVGARARRASSVGKDLASGSLSGLVSKAAGGSDDAQQLPENEAARRTNLLSASISEGEPPEPDQPKLDKKPPKPAPKSSPKPASKPPPKSEAKQPPAPSGPPKPTPKSSPKPASKPPTDVEQTTAPTEAQMVLHVAASESADAKTREVKIPARVAQENVQSVVEAVSAALGVSATQVMVWDDDFEEYAVLEKLDDLEDGAKIYVVVKE